MANPKQRTTKDRAVHFVEQYSDSPSHLTVHRAMHALFLVPVCMQSTTRRADDFRNTLGGCHAHKIIKQAQLTTGVPTRLLALMEVSLHISQMCDGALFPARLSDCFSKAVALAG